MSMVAELVDRVFDDRDEAHREHWNTRSYAAHVALGDFYDAVIDKIDAFVEAYQGQFGLIGKEEAEEPESDEAKTIVAGDRASDYGDANESFSRIAKLWSAYTGTTITPWDVAQMMILLKVSRAKTSRKRDTLVDIVGYAECASKLEEPK